MSARSRRRAAFLALLLLPAARPAVACLADVGYRGGPSFTYLFPNWKMVNIVDFDTIWGDGTYCGAGFIDATLRALTIYNYGTADGGDISALYACFGCQRDNNGDCSGATLTLTYRGLYNDGTGNNRPAWTWAGTLALNADPCNGGPGGCACIFAMHLYADIASCPKNNATVALGPGYNALNLGGLNDSFGFFAPYTDTMDPNTKVIVYAVKEVDKAAAAPGDTITYTIYYGMPGTGVINNVVVFDTLPPYTHYIVGSANVVPDAGWDPDPGPPLHMQWTRPGAASPPTSAPSSAITFRVTVDWGNGEAFEPGSGDIGAPEGIRLGNRAQVSWLGAGACALSSTTTVPTSTNVRRFMFWKIGDNDQLFSQSYGQPPDEMTYEIFVQNLSGFKTWWNVSIWDSVPLELDPWPIGFGFEDPCVGWTMTPSGCSAANPGRKVTGGVTMLSWTLDMPPGMTLTLRWKSNVKSSVAAGSTAVNRASILAGGRPFVLNGTGSSVTARNFAHIARIELPTTYISYVAFAASDDDNTCPGYFIDFFPLNKKTTFELRAIWYSGAGWATDGGKSDSIGCLIGDCLGGFPGNPGCTLGAGAIPGGGNGGCRVERIPARYFPPAGCGNFPYPANYVHKLTSNAPVLWQLLTGLDDDNQDNHTYAPSTTLSYTGLMHYMWRREDVIWSGNNGMGDNLVLISTNMDGNNVFTPNLETTVFLFKFDFTTLTWDYYRTYDLASESVAVDQFMPLDAGPWRTVSSDSRLIVNHAMNTFSGLLCSCSQCCDNFDAYMPTRETGNTVGGPGSANFYGVVHGNGNGQKVIIGNVSGGGCTGGPPPNCYPAANANYTIWKYVPDNTIPTVLRMPAMLNGTSGVWAQVTADMVPAGLAAAGNPQKYGAAFNAPSNAAYKVELQSGGPIQVLHGMEVYAVWSGGTVIHSANATQSGIEFWLHHAYGANGCGLTFDTQVIDVFCSKTGTAIQLLSQYGGVLATYATDGPDQVIAFMKITDTEQMLPTAQVSNNYKISVVSANPKPSVITQFIQCKISEKGYTAPFLVTGTHYNIIAPPVVYVGEVFWITVEVLQQGGTLLTTYTGITSFTSTDPLAQIEGKAMASYDYQWVLADGGDKMFVKVTLSRLGLQSIVGIDTTDGSITGITAIMVVGAEVHLTKVPPLQVVSSGDIVQFKICWSNYSTATATNFTVTDAIPSGMVYYPDSPSNHLCGATFGTGGITVAYSTNGGSIYNTLTGPATTAVTHLRWTVPQVGVMTTGCACFRVTVE